jgi:Arc/MetJ-type ribon-helix-helix transcriptional regulator
MPTEKLSITLPAKTLKFIDEYRRIHSLKSRTDVIELALAMLRETEREEEMSEAPEEDELTAMDMDTERGEADERMR